jgi:hypothetical protein
MLSERYMRFRHKIIHNGRPMAAPTQWVLFMYDYYITKIIKLKINGGKKIKWRVKTADSWI